MAWFPIEIKKIKLFDNKRENIGYLISQKDKGVQPVWKEMAICYRDDLIRFRDELNKFIDDANTAEILNIPVEQANRLDKAFQEDEKCKNCEFKMTHTCVDCLINMDSPLERNLFLELRRNKINFEHHIGLDHNGGEIKVEGRKYDNPKYNFTEVLTVPDFFIRCYNDRLCVYVDGHKCHNETEEKVLKDRKQDRKLQELGYKVLRYTGKEVNENMGTIIREIKDWINKRN